MTLEILESVTYLGNFNWT